MGDITFIVPFVYVLQEAVMFGLALLCYYKIYLYLEALSFLNLVESKTHGVNGKQRS